MKKISVSFLSSKKPINDLLKLEKSSTDYIHVDVMDGRFVKKKNNPFKVLKKNSSIIKKRLDVHLMEKKPFKNINKYATLNVEYITVHAEIEELDKAINLIKEYGIKCGIALNPETSEEVLAPYMDKIDMVLVMSVNPGMGGQEFIGDSTKKILKIKKMIVTNGRKIRISVDGGVNAETSKLLSFVDILVSGSYVLNSENYDEAINLLRENADLINKKDIKE